MDADEELALRTQAREWRAEFERREAESHGHVHCRYCDRCPTDRAPHDPGCPEVVVDWMFRARQTALRESPGHVLPEGTHWRIHAELLYGPIARLRSDSLMFLGLTPSPMHSLMGIPFELTYEPEPSLFGWELVIPRLPTSVTVR